MATTTIGRPKCGVCNFFQERLCGKEFKGKYPTNMKKHLHPQHFKVLETEEVAKKSNHSATESSQTVLKQSKLLDCNQSKKYDPESRKHVALTRRLALFVGATNVPLRLVDNEEFRELLTEFDPRYQIPHRQKLSKEIENLFHKLRNKLSISMQAARKLSLCADIWSKQGMTASFLGITCHYFNHSDMKRHSITLAVKRFPSPHTAARVLEVFESVIEDWKLPVLKIFRVLTDNGSNMLAAFTGDNEREDDTMNISDIEEDNISDDDDKLNDAAVLAIDAGEEVIELDLEDYEDISASSQKAIEEFERSELDHHSTFHNYKRVSCFIHTLQLVVKVFEVNPSFSATLKKAHCIVRKYCK